MRGSLRLPWHGAQVPHAVLDILRGCNIRCHACYNQSAPLAKSLAQLEAELDLLLRLRRLDSVAIAGGEPLLHPELLSIISLVKSRGLGAELFSNGVLLSPAKARELKHAGLDLLFVHVDARQQRPDLPRTEPEMVRELRCRLLAVAATAGLECGLAITAYPDAPQDLEEAIRFVLLSPHADYLLATLHRDAPAPQPLSGDLTSGLRCAEPDESWLSAHQVEDMQLLLRRVERQFGIRPFAYIPSTAGDEDVRWLTYLAGTVFTGNRQPRYRSLRVSAAERLFLRLHRRFKGRYPFFLPHAPRRFRVQLVFNAISGGGTAASLCLLALSLVPGSRLRTKRLLLQSPARINAAGELVHCEDCPDATVRHGRLVPVCVSDDVMAPARAGVRQ